MKKKICFRIPFERFNKALIWMKGIATRALNKLIKIDRFFI